MPPSPAGLPDTPALLWSQRCAVAPGQPRLGSPGKSLWSPTIVKPPSHFSSCPSLEGQETENASASERYSPAKCPVGEVTACGRAGVAVQSTVASGLSPAAGPWGRDGDRAPSTSPQHLRGHRRFTEPGRGRGRCWACPALALAPVLSAIYSEVYFFILAASPARDEPPSGPAPSRPTDTDWPARTGTRQPGQGQAGARAAPGGSAGGLFCFLNCALCPRRVRGCRASAGA